MDAAFDDGLSEDWVSQPRSSDISASHDDASILRRSTSGSRIPILKSQSTPSLPRRASGRILLEKPPSALNIEKSHVSKPPPESKQHHRRSSAASIEELGSVRRGTVQHKEQEGDNGPPYGTPEWKRRLLDSRGAAGKQRGLFSPIGLENVFRPPTVRKEAVAQLRGSKSSALPTSVPPSSPPILPNRDLQSISLDSPDESVQLPPLASFLKPSRSKPRLVSKAGSRSFSGKSYLQHESFSPIQVAHPTVDHNGKETFRDTSQNDRSETGHEDMLRPTSSRSDSALEIGIPRLPLKVSQIDPDSTSISLPDDWDAGSEAYAFVTMKRGGFSSEGSFQKRPLSPSSFQPVSTPTVPQKPDGAYITRPVPQTPRMRDRLGKEPKASQKEAHSSGSPNKLSPLKLFDNYDTFTKDRLSRRISQFETRSEKSRDLDDLIEDQLDSTPSPKKQPSSEPHLTSTQERKKRMSSFGDGMLDRFGFTHSQQSSQLLKWPGLGEMAVQSDPALPLSMQKDVVPGIFRSTGEVHLLGEGKRLRSSPQKVPDAKRRRTINEDAEPSSQIEMPTQRLSLSQSNSMAGKKRKDARYDHISQTADPDIIATRHMLRPRAHQHSVSRPSRQVSHTKTAETEETMDPIIDLEAATGVLAGELANLALNVAQGISNGVRKKSVTTADFFQEANLIMQNLRLNATQRSSAENGMAFESSRLQEIEESAADIFSTDNFSRPPSREGSPSKRRVPGPKDFRVISRLRKFEDTDDIGLALNSSFQGLPNKKANGHAASEISESEPANIRILDPPSASQPSNRTSEKHKNSNVDDKRSGPGTYPSSKSSSNRSVQTGSSGTHTKAVIAPDKVSHLISDNMGRMTFDYEKRCWVKRRSSEDHSAAEERLESEATEDDPFKEIPDLDVDESRELKTVRTDASPVRSLELPKRSLPLEELNRGIASVSNVPVEEDVQNSIMPKSTQSNSSRPMQQRAEPSIGENRQRIMAAETALSRGEVADASTGSEVKRRQARAVTVAFSSPLVQPVLPQPDFEGDQASDLELNASQGGNEAHGRLLRAQQRKTTQLRFAKPLLNTPSSSTRRVRASQALSKIEECSNTPSPARSTSGRNTNFAVALATPQAMIERADGAVSLLATAKSYEPLQLTPLSDFTVHHADESLNLDAQYLARRSGLMSVQEIEGQFSLSIKDLVQKIADVEPYEPYWEHMRTLNLQDRGLLTLHMLDDFCSRVEELDVSSNELGQLNGAPQSLRVLEARNNCLSSLTAWGHLQNLQYVDISNNDIDSLTGFRELIHIRELKAENNQIDSLDGVLHLNGLLRLSLGKNRIKNLDFHESDLRRLSELDLHHNSIELVDGIEQLISLQKLNMRNNKLKKLGFNFEDRYECLEFLDVSGNELVDLEIAPLSRLRDLLLDSNHVSKISGLENRFNVHRISWRGQEFPQPVPEENSHPLNYSCCSEVRSLSLAGSRLLTFSPTEAFLSLEHLDLASCGLDSLAEGFGSMVPNVRHLNLNYNAIRDLRPLLGIRKLSELHVAGNRIMRFRRTTEVICRIGEHMRVLDCRNNAFTSGFYLAPHLESSSQKLVVKNGQSEFREDSDPFNIIAYVVPDADSSADEGYLQQLDFGTGIRRRVYELLLLKASRHLEKLDGLQIDGGRILAMDGVWDRLVQLGVLQLASEKNQ